MTSRVRVALRRGRKRKRYPPGDAYSQTMVFWPTFLSHMTVWLKIQMNPSLRILSQMTTPLLSGRHHKRFLCLRWQSPPFKADLTGDFSVSDDLSTGADALRPPKAEGVPWIIVVWDRRLPCAQIWAELLRLGKLPPRSAARWSSNVVTWIQKSCPATRNFVRRFNTVWCPRYLGRNPV